MSVEELVKRLNKKSKLKVTVLSDESSPCIIHEIMPTGCLALDSILGGGLPVGRITEVYGDESTGKSLIAAQVAAIAQDEGHIVLYIDTESAVSIDIVKEVGVDINNLIYTVPDTLDGDEGVFQLMENTIEDMKVVFPNKLLLIIWDTIAATSSIREMEGEYGKAMMGQHAQLISQGLRRISSKISKERVCALFVNQTRVKLGVMFGDNVATFGGKAVAFYSSVRIELTGGKKIKRGKKIVGIENTARIVKNKVFIPFGVAVLPIYFGHGIDDALASFEFLKEAGYFKQSGAWYEFEGSKFQRSGWSKVFDEKYDRIENIILGVKEVEDAVTT